MSLTERIKKFAADEAGFDLVGVSFARLPDVHADTLKSWIEKGYAGTMGYMTRDGAKRAEPEHLLPGARSVISLAVNYYHPEDPKPQVSATKASADTRSFGRVAKYAYGADYHDVIREKLKKLAAYIKEEGGPGTQVKATVDTSPILEKAFAREAGLGFFGKNTNLITRGFGSWAFLASLVTNLELEPDAAHTGSCGSCRLCIDACPTGALLGNYELDARRCIAYLTIETKNGIPDDLKGKMGEWVFGCDICQDVCPYNFRAKTTRHREFYPGKIAGTWIDREKADKEALKGSPLTRAKHLFR